MSFLLGEIDFSDDALTAPTSHSTSMKTTIAQYAVNRGKPVPHVVGDELTTKSFSFMFHESFCNVTFHHNKLLEAFATKSPLALVPASGVGFRGTRYIVEALDIDILGEDGSGNPVHIVGNISLLEDPLAGGLGQMLQQSAIGKAVARGTLAGLNALARRF